MKLADLLMVVIAIVWLHIVIIIGACGGLWVCLRRLEWGWAGHRVDGVIMAQVNTDHMTGQSDYICRSPLAGNNNFKEDIKF